MNDLDKRLFGWLLAVLMSVPARIGLGIFKSLLDKIKVFAVLETLKKLSLVRLVQQAVFENVLVIVHSQAAHSHICAEIAFDLEVKLKQQMICNKNITFDHR